MATMQERRDNNTESSRKSSGDRRSRTPPRGRKRRRSKSPDPARQRQKPKARSKSLFDTMNSYLARPRSTSRKRSASRSSSDQTTNDATPYRDPRYRLLLESQWSFMRTSELGVSEVSKALCKALCEPFEPPTNPLFVGAGFEKLHRSLAGRSEAKIFHDLTPLIVPSAEGLACQGDVTLECLVEAINETWSNSRPLTGPPPKPDYAVGFRLSAFTSKQLHKLEPLIGDVVRGDLSYYMGISTMLFPFLTCEVKCGRETLDIADCQNSHSMTLAVRGVVKLFQLVGRAEELNRQILGFSISHDDKSVRIYGHYPVLKGTEVEYYRHDIRKYDLTDMDGRDKYTSYGITRRIYNEWVPKHLGRLQSAIDLFNPDDPLLSLSIAPGHGDDSAHETSGSSVPQEARSPV